MSDLDRVFTLTGEIMAKFEAGRPSYRVLLERDRLLWTLPDSERRLYFAWADQEHPS